MKKETKRLIYNVAMWFSPVFTIIMFALPWFGLYKYSIGDYDPTLKYFSYMKLFDMPSTTATKVFMWISLSLVIVSAAIYIVSVFFKKKQKLLNLVASVVLVVALALLIMVPLFKNGGNLYKEWFDFLTLPYGFALIYAVVIMILSVQRLKAKK